MSKPPVIFWFRRDLRLSDHPGLAEAARSGHPVIPVFICDGIVEGTGAAPKWRLGLGVEQFARSLEAIGSRLILRRGDALECLEALVSETGAKEVRWTRAYDPDAIARDRRVKEALSARGLVAGSRSGHLLFEPWTVETKTGGFYKVYSPFWRAVKDQPVVATEPKVTKLAAPESWPESDNIADWNLGHDMRRGAAVVAHHVCVGEDRALERLDLFVSEKIADYKAKRDFPSVDITSRLSENLTYGEISPRQLWHMGQRAVIEGAAGAEHFLKEVVWREFAYHLIYHTPHMVSRNWREEWDNFGWSEEEDAQTLAWKQGRTGVQFVDAAMREMFVTGTMHNRARMIAGSYLTKHMLKHWKIGLCWFEECLIDWDPASNAMGWQWVAGSGPDAAPYFRIFNPDGQADKFDAQGEYRKTWLPELGLGRRPEGMSYFEAVPKSWGLDAGDAYPAPIVPLAAGRARALEAYERR